MNHSLRTADRTTHVKIVMLALVFGSLMLVVGSAARFVEAENGAARSAIGGSVIKAGKSTTYTDRVVSLAR